MGGRVVSEGRTIWFPLDTGWFRREHVVELGEEFGPVGPLVLAWLSLEAKMQNDGGVVKAGPKAVARGVFSDAVTVSHVLSRAVRIGALHHYSEHDGRFTCTISGWEMDNRRGWDSFRKADSRAKNRPVVTECHDESRPVTEVPPREEKRTEGTTTPLNPPNGEFEEWLAHHEQVTGMRPPGKGTKARAHIASMFAARRAEYELADLKLAVAGAYGDEYRREHGHYDHESVLRPTKVHKLIEKGRIQPFAGRRLRSNADVLRVLEGGAS